MKIKIYGKDGCPYTDAALRAHQTRGDEVSYLNVKSDPALLDEMLVLSQGQRRVPVIVAPDGKVTIGFGGT